MKKRLETVTLLGIDCVNLERIKTVMEICQRDFEFAAVKILSSLPGDEAMRIEPINSLEEYSHFILWELSDYIDTPHALIVQYDGFILNSEAWDDEFLKYDYVGAPWLVADWSVQKYDFPENLLGSYLVGNGGFSLRSKKLLSLTSKLTKNGKIERYNPEDVAICVYHRQLFEDGGIKFAPVNLAKKFSFEAESLSNYAWNGQFGFHGLKWTDISLWKKKNPHAKLDNPGANETERRKWL